jgi:hypothetical protein
MIVANQVALTRALEQLRSPHRVNATRSLAFTPDKLLRPSATVPSPSA